MFSDKDLRRDSHWKWETSWIIHVMNTSKKISFPLSIFQSLWRSCSAKVKLFSFSLMLFCVAKNLQSENFLSRKNFSIVLSLIKKSWNEHFSRNLKKVFSLGKLCKKFWFNNFFIFRYLEPLRWWLIFTNGIAGTDPCERWMIHTIDSRHRNMKREFDSLKSI